ncbi:MAG: xylulokinase [Bacteroidota bacterium]
MSYLMGIDLGTSSVKTIIMDLDGNILGLGQEDYEVQTPNIGYAEQDIELLWEATVRTIKMAITSGNINPSDIKGIGLSGQMHGLVLLDKWLKPIRPAIIWADQRTKQQIDKIYSIIGMDEFRKTALNSLCTGFFICSLLWIKDNEPESYQKAYKAILPKDYIRYKLCGAIATDVTDASSTLAFDTANRCWAFNIIEKLGINPSLFPKYGEAYQVAGETSKDCEGKTGLRSKTPVVYGGGDSLMYSVGNGIIKPGVVSVNIGTAGQLATAVNTPIYDRDFRTNTFCHVKDDLWIIFGGHLNGGITLKWLRNNFFPHLSYLEFDDTAEGIAAGSEGALFLPYLSGERTPYLDPFAKGIFFGITLRHSYKHMIRAVMEGVVLSLRLSLEIFKELGIPIERVVASGGGARSNVWLQMQADIFKADIYTVSGMEEACTGAAIVAGVGVNIYKSIEQACSSIVRYNPKVTLPNPENVKVYDEAFEKFKLLYLNNKNLF